MRFLDNPDGYGAVSRLNHWLGAVLVIGLLALGLYFHEMPRGDDRMYWQKLHVAIGALVILPLLFRVGWRLAVRSPLPLRQSPVLQLATGAVHGLLLLGLAVLLLSGPVIVWTVGAPVSVFDWFSIASPTGRLPELHEALEGLHAVASRIVLILIVLHVLAALKHALADRGTQLRRMVGRLKEVS